MVKSAPNVRLNLLSTPENVVLVREVLSGLGIATGIDGGDLNDIRTAVTEVCNNVVLHAYAGSQGPLELEVRLAPDALEIVVGDRGGGMPPIPDPSNATTPGIGLHVIETLTRSVEFVGGSSGGTKVRMTFAAAGAHRLEPSRDGSATPAIECPGSPAAAIVSISPIDLAGSVLPRIVSALAARAHFSTDRISDAQLLADALVAHAHGSTSGDHLNVEVSVEPRDLELRIAPLELGRAQRLIGNSEIDGLGRVIEKLADRHDVATAGSYETLTVGLVDRR